MASSAVVAGKRALRGSLRQILSSIPSSELQFQSGLVSSHVTSHPEFRKAQVVSCYLSMPSGEVDTCRLVLSILEAGKILFVPRVDQERGEIDMLRIYDEHDLKSLSNGVWGIPEPGLERKNGQRRENAMDPGSPILDLVLLPGMAFDESMSRLGHGKGYYDRFLTSYWSCIAQRSDSQSRPLLLALSLKQQLLDPSLGPIPITNHDWKVDGVFHPGGLLTNHEISNN